MEGLGAGLGAIAFWGFLAAVVVGGIWYGLRERQAQYATLQRMLDGSQPIDEAIVDKVLGGGRRMDLGLKVAAWIVLFTAPGLAVLGWFIGQLSPPWQCLFTGWPHWWHLWELACWWHRGSLSALIATQGASIKPRSDDFARRRDAWLANTTSMLKRPMRYSWVWRVPVIVAPSSSWYAGASSGYVT